MEAICLSAPCILPRSTNWAPWSETTTTETVYATVDVPTTIYAPTSTEIISVTDTVTTATTAPIVLTVTTTSTLRVTLCETRDVNPTYTAPLPLATDGTWGCPPGTICKPVQVNCNFERGVPSDGYHCSPDQCVPVPALLPLTFWGEPVVSDESPLNDDTLFFDISSGYFNMNPLAYDLSYDIFYQTTVYIYTTTIYPPSPTGAHGSKRQSQIYIPAVCYDECNNAMLEAQTMGKTPALCLAGSAFEVATDMCELCITVHTTNITANFVEIQPQFQQFLNYCSKLAQQPTSTLTQATVVPLVTTMAVSETVTLSSSTYTFILPTNTESTGSETIYPSSQGSTKTVVTGATATATATAVNTHSPTLSTFITTIPAGSTGSAVISTLTTVFSGPATGSAVISTVITLSAGPSSAGGTTTGASVETSPTSEGTGAAGTTTPAAPSQFTGAAAQLSPLTGPSQLWIGSCVFMVVAADRLLFV